MKNNIFGYLFIIFIIGIMIFAIYKANKEKEETPTNSATTSSISTEEKGKEIVLAVSGFDTINPIITKNKNVQDVTKIIYEPLVNITEDFRLEACLATEWAKTNNVTYLVKLRQNVKWSNGTKFNSSDVKYTIDKLKQSGDSVYSSNVAYVKEVDIVDDYTVRIILSQEVEFFEYYLNFPILSSSFYGEDDFWNTDKNKAPVTTGKFKISELTNSTIVLTPNNNWWNKKNESITLEKITINLYSTPAELYNAFKLGGIDLITTSNEKYQDYIGTIGYNTTEVEGREFIFLAINTWGANGLLSDVNLRKAIRGYLNKEELVSNSYGSFYKSANFPLNTSNYSLTLGEENFYNLEESNNILSGSGWLLKNKIWQKSINYKNTKLSMNLVVKASDSKRVAAAENIKAQLLNQGINIEIIYAQDNEYQAYLQNKNYDMILCKMDLSIAPDVSTLFAENNPANYYNEEINNAVKYLDNITDENELKSNYQKIYDAYVNDVPYIGIARNKTKIITNTRLVGDVKANWYSMFYNIKDWYTK